MLQHNSKLSGAMSHHHHHHDHPHAPQIQALPSLLRLSALQRVIMATAIAAVLWGAILWAIR
jgi:hypothetical protein